MRFLLKYRTDKPLALIMLLAVLSRLVAVFFAKGFGMHDDHFVIIESTYSWAHGGDFYHWLPVSDENTGPSGHSFLYLGFMYLIFMALDALGINNPQTSMWIIRFLHAGLSLITVYFGYRITLKIAGKGPAFLAGLMLAIFWFMPWLSVRNLIEVVCIPFLVMGTWYLLKDEQVKPVNGFFSGFMFALAFAVRYQVFVYIAGVLLALIIQKQWKATLYNLSGMMVSVFLTQGMIDLFIWGKPFAELWKYIDYNVIHAYEYIIGPWYSYLLLLLAILIPPVSFFIFWGFLRNWKKLPVIVLPVLLFILFHSVFPNKQERFILPVVPFLIIAGIAGWQEYVATSGFWSGRPKLIRASWIFFWVVNGILLIIISGSYSKKARVESMTYLSKYPDIEYVLFDDTFRNETLIPPTFYYGERLNVYTLCGQHPYDSLSAQLEIYGAAKSPRFILFFQDQDITQRVGRVMTLLPNIEYETRIDPGLLDRVLYWLNPVNANQTIIIYRNRDFFPEKRN
jgi:4-amino-4-deoxy-L-arabinose transferase-like glycosyltransferase